ncbi:MAG: hypothetical protein NTW08_08595 [Gammaproteobacteria bacterium]|nr:hypothetical protein [Gammaproteobacteria bacterium]
MPATNQEQSTVKNALKSIRQASSFVSSYVLAGILMIFRPLAGVVAFAGFGTVNMVRNGVGVIVGGLAEFTNLVLRRGLGAFVGVLGAAGHLAVQLAVFVTAIISEIGVNLFRTIAAVALELGWLAWSALLKPLVGVGLVLANTLRQGLGGVLGLIAELFNMLRLATGFVIGFVAEIMVTLVRGGAAVMAELAALLWPVAKLFIGAGAEVVNLLRQGAGFLLGLVASFIGIVWQGIGLLVSALMEFAAGFILGTLSFIIEVASALWALVKGPVALIAEGIYFLANAAIRVAGFVVLELLNATRVFVGYVLGAILGGTVGFLFGGFKGCAKTFNAVKNTFVDNNYTFGGWYDAAFSPMFGHNGAYEIGCIAGPIWNSSTYSPGSAAKSVFGGIYSVGGTFKTIYHHTVFGAKNSYHPSHAFESVHHSAFFGKKDSYEPGAWFSQLRQSSTYKAGQKFDSVFNHDVFGGQYQFAHAYRKVRNSAVFSGSVGGALSTVFYHPLFGVKNSFHPVDQFMGVWNSTTYEAGQALVSGFTLGHSYEFGQAFNTINSASGPLQPGKVFTNIFTAPFFGGGHYEKGKAFNIFNRSKLFGDQPWAEQHVARDAFSYCAKFEIDAGMGAWVKQAKADQSFFYKNANRSIALIVGLGEGLLLWPLHIVATAVVAFAGGFERGGLLGAIGNVIRDFFLISLTYPFRNAYRNMCLVLRAEQTDAPMPNVWFPVFHQDLNDAYTGADIDWSAPIFQGEEDHAANTEPFRGEMVMGGLGRTQNRCAREPQELRTIKPGDAYFVQPGGPVPVGYPGEAKPSAVVGQVFGA